MPDKMTQAKAIREFFGTERPGVDAGSKVKSFMDEYKALSLEDRLELAQRIAKQNGLTQDQCDFALA